MNKLFIALAVASMSLLAAPPADAKKECPKEGCTKTEKACDKQTCDPKKADKKGCCPPNADKKACDQKDCKDVKKA